MTASLHDLDKQDETVFSSSNDNKVSQFNQGLTDGGKAWKVHPKKNNRQAIRFAALKANPGPERKCR
jgi:hypothetical protein